MEKELKRRGVLLHFTSLRGGNGVGGFGKEAYDFVDFLAAQGLTLWQFLPIFPLGGGISPYQSVSAFAIEPRFLDLTELADKGLLTEAELNENKPCDGECALYEESFAYVDRLTRLAFGRISAQELDCVRAFGASRKQVEEYCRFAALKQQNGGVEWQEWTIREVDEKEYLYQLFVQSYLFKQYAALKSYANSRGVSLVGDIPVYVSSDSADVWASPKQFLLDGDNYPLLKSGVPPDCFSATGQLWGNPVYDYGVMRRDGYNWWKTRLEHAVTLFDTVRIDHFRAFSAWWGVYGETAVFGKWHRGAGQALFSALKLNPDSVIAEDLGIITPAVKKLAADNGFRGMKVLQFAFGERNKRHKYLPHNYPTRCVAYTGTHDNDTLVGFCRKGGAEVDNALWYYGLDDGEKLPIVMLKDVFCSKADTAVIPMQDLLMQGSEARMNTPATVEGNWLYRMPEPKQSYEKAAATLALLRE